MESITVLLDDAAEFDRAVRDGLPEGRDLAIITKDNATVGGRPAACLTFTVQLRDGRRDTAQAVVPVRALLLALHGLMGRYSHLAEAGEPDMQPGMTLRGTHRGVAYDAVGVEQVWLISIQSLDGVVGIGKTREDTKAVAEGLINRLLQSG